MKPRELPLPALLFELAKNWPVNDQGLPREFLHRWEAAFGPLDPPARIGEDSIAWTDAFPNIRFRGMNAVQMLFSGGLGVPPEKLSAVRRLLQPGFIPILLVPAGPAVAQWKQRLPPRSILILGPDEIINVLAAADSSAALRKELRRQIPLGRLDPFDFQLPALGNMFHGREQELRLLLENDSHSFAIAGPGRIGKTSLVHAYMAALRRDHDPRIHRVREMDCLNMTAATSETALVRFIAGEIDKGRRASEMTLDDFPAFLRFQRFRLDGPLELIIDEVDGVCHTQVFALLAEAAKLQHCRLIMCGKANLLHHMMGKSPLAMRLKLIRPEPLNREEARRLLTLPLRDLDIGVEAAAVEMALNLTGNLPHQLQYYASQYLAAGARQESSCMTVADLEIIRDGLISQEFLRSALSELDPVSRVLALLILDVQPLAVSVPILQQLAQRQTLVLGAEKAMNCLISLHIHNFLALERGEYRIASGSLIASAHRHGFLKADLKEAVEVWRQRQDLGQSHFFAS